MIFFFFFGLSSSFSAQLSDSVVRFGLSADVVEEVELEESFVAKGVLGAVVRGLGAACGTLAAKDAVDLVEAVEVLDSFAVNGVLFVNENG